MLSLKQAQKIILNHVKPLGTRKILLEESLGYVLAKDVISPLDIPSFDNSAMDGYAVRTADIPGKLKVIEEIPAGHFPRKRVGRGEAALIMTGSAIPKGADTVVMVEDTKGEVEVLAKVEKGKNIRRKGEVIRRGQVLLKKGVLIRPQEIALLASVNIDKVLIFRKPIVAVLSTGDEVVLLGQKLPPGKIVDSNRYGVIAQLENAGFEVIYDLGIAKDNEKEIEKKIKDGVNSADVLLTIGGVSVGEWDLVKKMVQKMGKMIFWKISMKPGGPTAFGKIQGKPWFGLPGNPVAALVAFDQIVLPALLKMSGRTDMVKPSFSAVLEKDYRGSAGKVRLERALITYRGGKYFVRPVRSLGSADMLSLTKANGLMMVGEKVARLKAGAEVRVHLL